MRPHWQCGWRCTLSWGAAHALSRLVIGATWVLVVALAVVGALWHTPLDDLGSILLSTGVVTGGAALFEHVTNRRGQARVRLHDGRRTRGCTRSALSCTIRSGAIGRDRSRPSSSRAQQPIPTHSEAHRSGGGVGSRRRRSRSPFSSSTRAPGPAGRVGHASRGANGAN